MGLGKLKLLPLLLVSIIFSCTSGTMKDIEEQQRNALSMAIISNYSGHLTVRVHPFMNVTGDPDLDYLSNGLPEMIISQLKPIENEKAYISFKKVGIDLR